MIAQLVVFELARITLAHHLAVTSYHDSISTTSTSISVLWTLKTSVGVQY